MKGSGVYSIMRISIGNLKLLFLLLMSLTTVVNSTGQTPSAPFTLKDGSSFTKHIRLSYREQDNSFNVFTFKFKITPEGKFDTLYAYENNMHKFAISVRNQLENLNGKWNINSLPKKKWAVMRFYIAGYIESSDSCTNKIKKDFIDAYKREAELFLCEKDFRKPCNCVTPYLAGNNYYYYPPFLSMIQR